MQSGLPADAASLRETGSVDKDTPRGPVSHGIVELAAVQCIVSLLLSLMAQRVCTLVLSSFSICTTQGGIKKFVCILQYLPAIQVCSSPLLHTHTFLLTRIAHLHFTLERAWTDLVISTLHAMARQKWALKVCVCVCLQGSLVLHCLVFPAAGSSVGRVLP